MSAAVSRHRRVRQRLLDWFRWHGHTRTILQGPAAGLRIGKRYASADYAEGANELPVQEALTRLLGPGDTFFDIGANVGFFSLLAARLVGSEGRVVAFEAVPDIADALTENARSNGFAQIEVRAVAIGASQGFATLRLTDHPGGATIADDADATGVTKSMKAEVVSIDSLLASGDLSVPDVVKIDVEGHERATIDGMRELLSAHRPTLIVELDASTVSRLALKQAEIEHQLHAIGYKIEALSRSYAETDWQVVHIVGTAR